MIDSAASLICRPCLEADAPFLTRLYAVVHAPEFMALGLPAEMLEKLLRQQSFAQESGYRQQFPCADRRIIELNGIPIGRMIVDVRPDRLHLVDIALGPAYHRQGIGGELLRRLIEEAAGRPIELQVMTSNPARKLYQRIGFRQVAERLPYLTMEYAEIGPCSTSLAAPELQIAASP